MTERRHYGIREYSFILALMMNFGGLVWGAATLKGAVDAIDDSSRELKVTITAQHRDYDLRLRVIESELAVLQTKMHLYDLTKGKTR